MCLDTIDKNYDPHLDEKEREGWKVFLSPLEDETGYVRPPIFRSLKLTTNMWVEDANDENIGCLLSVETYKAGFHVFATMQDALNYILPSRGELVYCVRGRGITAEGVDSNRQIFVCREIFIYER